jgi:hypothetical protein
MWRVFSRSRLYDVTKFHDCSIGPKIWWGEDMSFLHSIHKAMAEILLIQVLLYIVSSSCSFSDSLPTLLVCKHFRLDSVPNMHEAIWSLSLMSPVVSR